MELCIIPLLLEYGKPNIWISCHAYQIIVLNVGIYRFNMRYVSYTIGFMSLSEALVTESNLTAHTRKMYCKLYGEILCWYYGY